MRNSFALVVSLACVLGAAACGGGDDSGGTDAKPANDAGVDSQADASHDAPPGGTPSVSIASASVAEGNSGTTSASFTVTLSAASATPVTVDFATADGTALAGGDPDTGGADYTQNSGTLTFAAGETQKTISISIAGDALNEDDETFKIDLSNATGANLGTSEATGTITNDDATPTLAVADTAILEGTATTTLVTATVTLSAPSGRTVTVDVATADGTALAGADYTATTTAMTFAPGQTSQTLSVAITTDALDEDDEQFTVGLANAVHATIADAQGTITITDDDDAPTVSLQDASIVEGNTATATALIPITLSTKSGRTVTVTFATADDTATSGTDYVATTGTITFAPGETAKSIPVTVNGDTTVESDEDLFVNLSAPTNVTIADGQATLTILDDDSTGPRISIADTTVTEGNTGTTTATFNVTLSAASTSTVTVNFATVDGTAVSTGSVASGGQDYTPTSGTVSFTPGQTTKTISVPVRGDTLNEADETFSVVLANATNGTIQRSQAQGTITNDDAQPSITIANVTTAEGNAGSVNATFTLTLSAASGQTVTTQFATADGSATAGSDYTAESGTATFAAGTTTATIQVPILGDTLDEADETYTVGLSTPVNATLAKTSATGTITDNDPTPSMTIADVRVNEGAAGTTTGAVFTLTLSAASGRQVTVHFATADGTATAGQDYVAASGDVTFAPGSTTQTVTVTVDGDATNEANETFNVNLTAPTNATIADAKGVGTIVNDDSPLPNASINDVTVAEGNTGTVNAKFTVKLSATSTQPITIQFATADGTATAGTDYVATSGTLTIAAGQTTGTITVPVNGDTLFEADETFTVNLSNATNANLTTSTGTGTITDNDTAPTLSIAGNSTTEGDSGSHTLSFTVTLSKISGVQATVNFATAAGTATADADYSSVSGSLTFAPGETTKTIDVPILGDVLNEANETFTVKLSGAANATIATATGTGTITDDDALPTLSIGDTAVTEGNTGTTPATFTVTLSVPSGRTVTVAFAAANNTAVSPGDYTATSGTLTFAAGEVSKTVTVNVKGDTKAEPTESFFVNLSGPTNASIADGQGVCTITDND